MALSALSKPRWVEAEFNAPKVARSASENCTHMPLIFSMPTPCSRVSCGRPSATFFQIRAKGFGLRPLPLRGIKQNQRVQIADRPRAKHINALQPAFLLHGGNAANSVLM